MTLTSTVFLFIFLPLALLIYHISPDHLKEVVLVASSFLFYAILAPQYFPVFLSVIAFTIFIGKSFRYLNSKKAKVFFAITGIIGLSCILFFFKYIGKASSVFGFSEFIGKPISKILMPVGISFYIFRAISYIVDSYNGVIVPSESLVYDILYLSFFPQIISGPITRYNEFHRIKDINTLNNYIAPAVIRFMTGFCKKILIADILARISNEIFSTPFENFSVGYAWLGSICFSLQLFFDFSGYSDMAIGLSAMFGYGCKENFDYPYMTESVSGFWRRWHISLSEWFRDYIYIPLGGSRNKHRFQTYVNLLVVWALTGIWHGSSMTFIVWGLLYYIAISFERFTGLPKKINSNFLKTVYRILVLLFINFQWVIFNSPSLTYARHYLRRMIFCSPYELADTRALFLIKDYAFFIIISILLCFPIHSFVNTKISKKNILKNIYNAVCITIIFLGFILSIAFTVTGQNNTFLYAGF